MRSFPLGDLIDRQIRLSYDDSHYLYLVRDGDTVFYVGQSTDPIHRMHEHIGLAIHDPRFGDDLGGMIGENYPESRDWILELYTIADCADFVVEQYSEEIAAKFKRGLARMLAEEEDYRPGLVNTSEKALMRHFRACLNVANAVYESSIPERYTRRRHEHFVAERALARTRNMGFPKRVRKIRTDLESWIEKHANTTMAESTMRVFNQILDELEALEDDLS